MVISGLLSSRAQATIERPYHKLSVNFAEIFRFENS